MIKNYFKCVLLLVIAVKNDAQHQRNSLPHIACPNYFEYFYDGYEYAGRISLPLQSNYIELDVHLTQRQPLHNNYVGRIKLESRDPLVYRIEFPSSNEVPKLTKITVNNQDICTANGYSPPNTELFLSHKLTTKLTTFNRPQTSFHDLSPNTNNFVVPNDDSIANAIQDRIFHQISQQFPQPPQEVPQFSPPTSRFGSNSRGRFNQPSSTQTGRPQQCGEEKKYSAYIYGGSHVMPGQFPWLTAIYDRSSGNAKFKCGGSLITARTVLTAAHCIKIGNLVANQVIVTLGRHNLEDNNERGYLTREIQNIVIHPDFDWDALADADLAILELQQPVQYTLNIKPLCLWTDSSDVNQIVGQSGTVVGWGADETGRASTPMPKKVQIDIVSDSVCRRSAQTYRTITSERTFCAGNRDDTGPCLGDSGSGLMINRNGHWYLRGIVSAGQKEQERCLLTEYVIFCDVAKHMQWIQSNMI